MEAKAGKPGMRPGRTHASFGSEPMHGRNEPVSREECVFALREIAPFGERLLSLLSLPDALYMKAEDTSSPSLSSDPDLTIEKVASAIMHGQELPKSFPNYGLHISSLGSNVFCTFVDRTRGVIVHSAVRNMYAEEGSWASFEDALDEALGEARSLRERSEAFSFVVSREGAISRL